MGYRSDVRLVVTEEGFLKLSEFVSDYCDINHCDNLLNDLDVNKSTPSNHKLIGWNSIKWYEGYYDEVDAIIDGIGYISELGYGHNFARIGESYDDIEFEEVEDYDLNYVDPIYLVRSFDDEC